MKRKTTVQSLQTEGLPPYQAETGPAHALKPMPESLQSYYPGLSPMTRPVSRTKGIKKGRKR